jgi:nitrite reductase (NADH) small subunit
MTQDIPPAAWIDIGGLDEIVPLGSRIVRTAEGDIAVFRTADDSVFALYDRCPHKAGPLSQGIVHGRSVTCPLHSWIIDLASGEAAAPDKGCAHTISVRLVDGRILLPLGTDTQSAFRSEDAA